MGRSIPDWKKATIVALSPKYGYRSLGRELDIDYKTVRRYQKKAESDGVIEMDGINLKVKNAT